MDEEVRAKTKEIHDWVIDQRRNFHKHPEPSYKEFNTTKAIQAELEKMGIPTKNITETGVIGLLEGKGKGKVLGLRADIDALPVLEDTGLPFTSENVGFMHACGHDCHISTLLGAAKVLSQMKDRLNGTIKFIFQPAEELGTGAQSMVDAGVLKNPDVDNVFGMHIFSDFPVGKILVQDGPMFAGSDVWHLEVYGKQSHGSAPWQGVDANVCATAIVQGFQTIVSRVNDARLPIVINVGKIEAGDRFNITSGKAVLEGMNRSFDAEVRKKIPEWMETMVKGICEAYGCTYKFNYDFTCSPVINDPELTKIVHQAVSEVIGEENIVSGVKIMGGEDFSAYMDHIPGSFVCLGTRNEAKDAVYSQHSNHYKVDEDSLEIGIETFVQFALDYFK